MFISVAMKYLFPHPLPLWLAAAAVVVGHAPLLVLPGLLSRIELLYLSAVLGFLFFIRNRSSIFIRIIISVFLIANIQLSNTLSLFSSDNKNLKNIDIIVQGVIIKTTDFYSVKGKVVNINDEEINDDIYINIKIKGTFVPECAGEVWRIFRPVLRPVHKQLNEGQPDRQQYALSQRVLFSLTPGRSKKISSGCNLRQRVITAHFPQTDNFVQGGLMLALLFGERRGITPQQRVLVQETGVAHVVAISGLHIGLAALWGWWAGRIILLVLPQRLMSHFIPVLFSVCAAVVYVWLGLLYRPAGRLPCFCCGT
ncbi:MAG: ComEC/Rec2 family competence protein [Morganella sp. (in: enterobacteria)]